MRQEVNPVFSFVHPALFTQCFRLFTCESVIQADELQVRAVRREAPLRRGEWKGTKPSVRQVGLSSVLTAQSSLRMDCQMPLLMQCLPHSTCVHALQ